jgi:peptidase C39-like protein
VDDDEQWNVSKAVGAGHMHQQSNRLRLILLGAIALTLSDGVYAGATADERSDRMHAEWLRLRCGPRAAWAFSQCCGVPLDHDTTMASFVQHENAVSLREIADFLEASGIRCETRCLSPTDLTQEICPALVHLASTDERDEYGHFVVVIATDERGVTVVEPQVGRREKWTWQYFSDRWTGHCIIHLESYFSDQRLLWLCISLNLMVILCLIFR